MQGLGDFFCIIKRNILIMSDKIDLHGDGRRELGKIIVVREIPREVGNGRLLISEDPQGRAMPITDMLRLVRNDLDPHSAIGETDDSDRAGLMDDRLGALGIREAMSDGDMTIPFSVDTRHLAAEELAMGRGVTELVDGDEIMDHLMKDSVLNKVFGQVNADIDAQHEVFIMIPTEEALLAARESNLPEETFGMGEFDRDRRKSPAEIAGIELVEMLLNIFYGWRH